MKKVKSNKFLLVIRELKSFIMLQERHILYQWFSNQRILRIHWIFHCCWAEINTWTWSGTCNNLPVSFHIYRHVVFDRWDQEINQSGCLFIFKSLNFEQFIKINVRSALLESSKVSFSFSIVIDLSTII